MGRDKFPLLREMFLKSVVSSIEYILNVIEFDFKLYSSLVLNLNYYVIVMFI